jgi:hypothetical protein
VDVDVDTDGDGDGDWNEMMCIYAVMVLGLYGSVDR